MLQKAGTLPGRPVGEEHIWRCSRVGKTTENAIESRGEMQRTTKRLEKGKNIG
jgi:hypothetical protein